MAGSSADKNTYPNHLVVSPSSIKVDVVLEKETYQRLYLKNTSDKLVAFKIKTTAPNRYGVKPTLDYVEPGATRECEIVMARFTEYPTTCRDKFLVQSFALDERVPDLPKTWKERERGHSPATGVCLYNDQKIKCKLQLPVSVRAQLASERGLAESAELAAQTASAPASASSSSTSSSPPASVAAAVAASKSPPSRQRPNGDNDMDDNDDDDDDDNGRNDGDDNDSYGDAGGNNNGGGGGGGGGAGFDRDSNLWKIREYDELMEYVVKLTSESDKLKATTLDLQSQLSEVVAENVQMRARLSEAAAADDGSSSSSKQQQQKSRSSSTNGGNGQGSSCCGLGWYIGGVTLLFTLVLTLFAVFVAIEIDVIDATRHVRRHPVYERLRESIDSLAPQLLHAIAETATKVRATLSK